MEIGAMLDELREKMKDIAAKSFTEAQSNNMLVKTVNSTVYDEYGNKHYAIISVYDSNGQRHAVK